MSSIEKALQQQQQQRNEKKHRKLVRSPEKLSPCDYDSYPINNPSRLSASTNVFSTNPIPPFSSSPKNHHRSSPTKSYNDQFPPPPLPPLPTSQHQQQVWLEQQQQPPSHHLITIPPSSSAPSIALHRKPSITIKYSKDEDIHQHHTNPHPTVQRLSKNESNADQMSNNNDNFLINFNDQQQNLSPFNYEEFNSSNCDIFHQSISSASPTQSASLNLIHQTHLDAAVSASNHQIVFHSNNPFLSDNFDATTNNCEVEYGGENFFNIHDSNDSELLFIPDEELMTITNSTATLSTKINETLSSDVAVRNDGLETQLLKNKREKFSNASPTMKFCLLVVSPPSSKLLQVSLLLHLNKVFRLFLL